MENQKIAEKLILEGEKVELFFLNLTESQLKIYVHLDDQKWQIKDVLAHFVSAEKSFQFLCENIRNGGQGTPDDFSINEFNNSQVKKMKNIVPADLIDLFRETRAYTVNWIKGVSERDLILTGRHPAMGDASLGEMIRMIYLHNQMHMRDLKAAINTKLESEFNLPKKETA